MKNKDELREYLTTIQTYSADKNSESMTTGFPNLDKIICNGIPVGRSIEIFGDESGGKSSIALAMCGEFIRQGKRCLWVDIEDSYTKEYAELLGVDSNKLYVMEGMPTGEETFVALEHIIQEKLTDVIVIDSMSEAIPTTWLTNDLEVLPIGRRAALHARFLMHTRNDRIKNNITLIILNQTRNDPGDTAMFKSRKSTAGTSTLHEAKARIRMSRSGQLKKNDVVIGYAYKAEVVKNKVGPVKGVANFHYRIDTGFDKTWDLLDSLIEEKVIEKKEASFSFNGEKFAHGEQNAILALKDPAFLAKLPKHD